LIHSITITHDQVKSGVQTSPFTGILGTGAAKPGMGVGGIGDGRSSFSFDGGDFVNIFSAALASAFNELLGSMLVWVRITDGAVWADGVHRRFFTIGAATDRVMLAKDTAANSIFFRYDAGGVFSGLVDASLAGTTDWFLVSISWDKADDKVKCFINGAQVGATVTGLGIWVEPLISPYPNLGSHAQVSNFHKGLMAHAAIFPDVVTPAEMLNVYNSRTGDMRQTIMALGPTAYWMLDDEYGLWAVNEAGAETRGEKYHLNLVHEDSPGYADAIFNEFVPEEHAENGLYSCRYKIYGRLNTLEEMFERGLGRWMEAWGYGLEPEFEGMITEISFNLPPDKFTISLEPVANMAWMRADVDGDGVVDRSTPIQNYFSQALYPVSELIVGGGEVEGLSVANQAMQQYIDLRAFPRPSLKLGGASGEEYLEIFCRGFWWTLGRRVYNQTVALGTQALTAEVRDIAIASGEYIDSMKLDANTTLVTRELDGDRRPSDLITDMAKLGDATYNRWLAQMTGRRCTSARGRLLLLKQAAPPTNPPII